MGQYYKPLLIRNNRAVYFSPYVKVDEETKKSLLDFKKEEMNKNGHYYMMAKLTEHSWVGNHLVDGICQNLILKGPAQVAWIGDYADIPVQYANKNPWRKKEQEM